MSDYSEFFLSSSPSIVELDCIEITHPDFSQTYRIVRNHTKGVSVTHEGPAGPFDYEYYPCKVLPVGSSEDLDQAITITLGDIGEVIATEIGNLTANNSMNTEPVVNFRTYRSDDLTAPLFGPLTLIIKKVQTDADGSAFVAQARQLNQSRTGELYDMDRFPMLRGFE